MSSWRTLNNTWNKFEVGKGEKRFKGGNYLGLNLIKMKACLEIEFDGYSNQNLCTFLGYAIQIKDIKKIIAFRIVIMQWKKH